MNYDLIVITGASSGIGKELVRKAISAQFSVFALARREDELQSLQKSISVSAAQSLLIKKCDISNINEVREAIHSIPDEYAVHSLINNAGITSFSLAEDDSIDTIDEIIAINLMGSIYMIKSILPRMIKQHDGRIVNISSVVTKKILTKSSVYSASKSGLLAYSAVLREEVRKHGIKVLDIIPGPTETPIWANSVRDKYSSRMMKPDEVAHVIINLIKEDSSVIPEELILRPIEGDL